MRYDGKFTLALSLDLRAACHQWVFSARRVNNYIKSKGHLTADKRGVGSCRRWRGCHFLSNLKSSASSRERLPSSVPPRLWRRALDLEFFISLRGLICLKGRRDAKMWLGSYSAPVWVLELLEWTGWSKTKAESPRVHTHTLTHNVLFMRSSLCCYGRRRQRTILPFLSTVVTEDGLRYKRGKNITSKKTTLSFICLSPFFFLPWRCFLKGQILELHMIVFLKGVLKNHLWRHLQLLVNSNTTQFSSSRLIYNRPFPL